MRAQAQSLAVDPRSQGERAGWKGKGRGQSEEPRAPTWVRYWSWVPAKILAPAPDLPFRLSGLLQKLYRDVSGRLFTLLKCWGQGKEAAGSTRRRSTDTRAVTEALSGERTLAEGGSTVIEPLPMAKTYSTAAEHDSRQSGLLLGSEEAGRGLGFSASGQRGGVSLKRLESVQVIPVFGSDSG